MPTEHFATSSNRRAGLWDAVDAMMKAEASKVKDWDLLMILVAYVVDLKYT